MNPLVLQHSTGNFPHRWSRWPQVVGFLAALLLIGASPLLAAKVKIKSFRAPVEIQRSTTPDRWYPARVGVELDKGDVVRTGKKGRVILTMADGSRMILWPNSNLEIQETGKDRVFGLNFGRIKSIIKRLRGDRKFKVKTPLAAASVRGTVFEVGYNKETQSGFLDVSKGLVALSKGGHEVLVPAGRKIEYLPNVPLGNPVPRRAGVSPAAQSARAAVRREVQLGMSKEEVLAAAAEELRLAEYQVGKTLVDVSGKRVRLEEYVIRGPKDVIAADRDKAFKLVVLNERESRFDYFYYRGVFNATLPTDLSVALNDINGKLGTTAPDFYLTSYEMAQSNTQDFVKDNGDGGHLVKIEYDGTNYTLTDAADATNTRTVEEDEQTVVEGDIFHKIYDPINDRFLSLNEADFSAGDFKPAVYDPATDTFRVIATGDTYWRTRYNTYTHIINNATKQSYTKKSTVNNTLALDLDADFTFAGGSVLSFTETPSGADQLHNKITIFYGDGTTETVNTYIISDLGITAPTSAFSNITTGSAFKTELLKWNYQQITEASEFDGRKIDIVAEPKILIESGLIK